MRRAGTAAVLALLAAAAVLTAPAPAPAFLCPRLELSPFELLDRADEVAIVDGSGGAIRIEDVWKGAGVVWLNLPAGERPSAPPVSLPPPPARGRRPRRIIVLDEGSCRQDSLLEDVGSRVLAFATAEGWAAFPFGSSVVSLPPDSSLDAEQADALLEALHRWASERDLGARRRMLVELARRPDRVGAAAALHFATAPDLLREMSRFEALDLATSIEALLRTPDLDAKAAFLLAALERLHLPESVPILLSLLRERRFADLDRASTVREALARATGRELAGSFRWTQREWMRWWSTVATDSRHTMLTGGFATRGIADVDVDSARSLADVIRTAAQPADRSMALELCEIVVGRRIPEPNPDPEAAAVGSAWADGYPGHDPARWEALARACEEPAP